MLFSRSCKINNYKQNSKAGRFTSPRLFVLSFFSLIDLLFYILVLLVNKYCPYYCNHDLICWRKIKFMLCYVMLCYINCVADGVRRVN